MKILYHHRTLGDGAEGIHIREMIKAFRDMGHQVLVLGPTGEKEYVLNRKAKILSGIKKILPSAFFELIEICYNLYGIMVLYKCIKSYRPDFIYDRYITFNGSSVIMGKYLKIPVIEEINAPLALERSSQKDEKLFFKKTAYFIEKWICTNAAKTIVVSTPLAEYFTIMGVPDTKLVVMPNGVNKKEFYPHPKSKKILTETKVDKNDIIIGFSGILRPWHGIDILIKVAARLIKREIPVFLLIVGDGPIRQEIEKSIIDAGIGNSCEITGRVAHAEIPEYLNLFDIAVSPKATFYASPMKLIEYMAMGKASVVPNSKNFLDIVDVGINAITFEENNVDSLEDAIATLCKDAYFRKQLGGNARLKVEKRLNWEWNAREVCRLETLRPSVYYT